MLRSIHPTLVPPLSSARTATRLHPHRLSLPNTPRHLLPTTSTSSRSYTSPTPSLLLRQGAATGPRAGRSIRGNREPLVGGGAGRRSATGPDEYDPPYSPYPDQSYSSSSSSHTGKASLASSIPVFVGNDSAGGVLKDTDGAVKLLANSGLVIVRQLEMLNVFMGFEQANRYAILDPEGGHVGYMAEQEGSILSSLTRQALRTHRPFRSVVMDKWGEVVLRINRPFAFINSRIYVHAAEGQANLTNSSGMSGLAGLGLGGLAGLGGRAGGDGGREVDRTLIGETQQEWHPWRRRYNLFKHSDGTFKQFAKVDSGLWAWDFYLTDAEQRVMASINRNFAGFGRELFTDTGQYVVRFDAVEQEIALTNTTDSLKTGNTPPPSLVIPPSQAALTLDERAITLATAVTCDIDYFSRRNGSMGGMFPFMMFGGGGGEELGGHQGEEEASEFEDGEDDGFGL